MKSSKREKIYQTICNDTRIKILNMFNSGIPLVRVAKDLKINYSTVKTIIRIFRIERRILRKDTQSKECLKKDLDEYIPNPIQNCTEVVSSNGNISKSKEDEFLLNQILSLNKFKLRIIHEIYLNQVIINLASKLFY